LSAWPRAEQSSWSQRFAEIDAGALYWYEVMPGGTPCPGALRGEIELAKASVDLLEPAGKQAEGHAFAFQIMGEDDRSAKRFACESEKVLLDWVATLLAAASHTEGHEIAASH